MRPPCDHCGCPASAHEVGEWDGTECSRCSCAEYVLPSNEPTKAPETWQVIAPDGRVLLVETDSLRAWGAGRPQEYVVSDDGTREAVGMWAVHVRWPVAEVLAPGELSRADALGAAVQAATAVERARCAEVCRGFVRERECGLALLREHGADDGDIRLQWVGCKLSEARRCADAITEGPR